MRLRLALPLSLLLLLAAARSAAGQGRPATDSVPRFEGLAAILVGETTLAFEGGGDSASVARASRTAAAVARAYALVARSPALTTELLARSASTHLAGDVASASATTLRRTDEQLFRLAMLQAAQQARLVEQNDRIIALLEAAAKR